jgi:hypothetical protein
MSERYYSEPLARRGNKQKHYFYSGEKPFLFTRLQWIAWVDSKVGSPATFVMKNVL